MGIGQTRANIPSSPSLMMSMEYGAFNSFVAISICYSVDLYVVINLSLIRVNLKIEKEMLFFIFF